VYASTGRNELALAQRSDGDVIVRRSDGGRPGDHGTRTLMNAETESAQSDGRSLLTPAAASEQRPAALEQLVQIVLQTHRTTSVQLNISRTVYTTDIE